MLSGRRSSTMALNRPERRTIRMTATLAPPKPALAAPAPFVDSDHTPASDAEQRRWVIPLVLCFTWSAVFFALAVGTGSLYFLAPAGLGIGLIILFFVYLGLTSDTNSDA
jgi:hypothetical protein